MGPSNLAKTLLVTAVQTAVQTACSCGDMLQEASSVELSYESGARGQKSEETQYDRHRPAGIVAWQASHVLPEQKSGLKQIRSIRTFALMDDG